MKKLFLAILFITPLFGLAQKTVDTLDVSVVQDNRTPPFLGAKKTNVNYCDQVEVELPDKFDHTTTISTPLSFEAKDLYNSADNIYNVIYEKVYYGTKPTYYLRLTTTSVSAQATEHGVIILLRNGTRISKPNAKVETTVNSKAEFEVSTFITLTPADIAKLSRSPMTDFKLYLDRDEVTRPDEIFAFFHCLLTKKPLSKAEVTKKEQEYRKALEN